MWPEPERVSGKVLEGGLGSLSGCLVDSDAEQRTRERRIRRRALAISIIFQITVLLTLILVPLFGKAERITLTIVTPIPPYAPYHDASHNPGAQSPRPRSTQNQCRFCAPPNIPPTIVTRDSSSSTPQVDNNPPEGIGEGIPGGPQGLIQISDPRQSGFEPPGPQHQVARPQVVRMTHIDPAMLIHRVEPVYPPLAKQTHRDGRVELRAIIGTDGTIQSLQIVASDPLFDFSAREAVSQWRYRPTILDGQPVEIDTYITVIYTTRH